MCRLESISTWLQSLSKLWGIALNFVWITRSCQDWSGVHGHSGAVTCCNRHLCNFEQYGLLLGDTIIIYCTCCLIYRYDLMGWIILSGIFSVIVCELNNHASLNRKPFLCVRKTDLYYCSLLLWYPGSN